MKRKSRNREWSWKRLRRAVFAVAWVASMVLALLFVGRELMTSDRFAVSRVVVEGAERATVADVLALAEVPEQANVFRLDLDEVERRVLAHPWVQTVKVQRDLPRAVRIRVREHEPRVLVALGELYLANEEGEIIKSYEPGDPWSFPVITGLDRQAVERDDARLREPIRLVQAWSELDLPPLSEVRVHGRLGLSARTADGRSVRLGRGPHSGKLERLQQILQAPATRDAVSVRLDGDRRPDRATVVLPGALGGR